MSTDYPKNNRIARISQRTSDTVDLAEARHKLRRLHAESFTVGDAVDEYRSAEVLGEHAQAIFDRVVDKFMFDWLSLPLAKLDGFTVQLRFHLLVQLKELDAARWVLQAVRTLRNFTLMEHPEFMPFLPDDPCNFPMPVILDE